MMKTIIVTITLIVSSITFFSQPTYFSPNDWALYTLDSLSDVPYMPMNVRYNKKYSESFKEKFINYFGKDLQFIPEYSIYDMSYECFISDKKFAYDDDDIYNFVIIGCQNYVVGKSIVPIKSEKYKSIWILELYSKMNDTYCSPFFYERHDGTLEKIYFNLATPGEFISNEPNSYK